MPYDVYETDDLEKLWRHVHEVARRRKIFREQGGQQPDHKYLKRLAAKLKKPKKKKKPKRVITKDEKRIVFKFSQGNDLHTKRKKSQVA